MQQTSQRGNTSTKQPQRRQQRAKSASAIFNHYSGPMVNMSYVDQCSSRDNNQHLSQNERTRTWEPLGLDHQSGYSYLYQHSGYEWAEQQQQQQESANQNKMDKRQILD